VFDCGNVSSEMCNARDFANDRRRRRRSMGFGSLYTYFIA
jgi:hypothetical protein